MELSYDGDLRVEFIKLELKMIIYYYSVRQAKYVNQQMKKICRKKEVKGKF